MFGSFGWGIGKLLDYMAIDRVAGLFERMDPELAARLIVLTGVFSPNNVVKAWKKAGSGVAAKAKAAVPEISRYIRKLGLDAEKVPDHWMSFWPVPDKKMLETVDRFIFENKNAAPIDPLIIEGDVFDVFARYRFGLHKSYALRDPPAYYARFIEALYFRDPAGTVNMLRAMVIGGGPHKEIADILNRMRTEIAAVLLESAVPDVTGYSRESIDKLVQSGGTGLFRFLKLLSPYLFIAFLNRVETESPGKLLDYIDFLHSRINALSDYFARVVEGWAEQFPGELRYFASLVPSRYEGLRAAIYEKAGGPSSTKVKRGQYSIPQPVVSGFLEELEQTVGFRSEKNVRTFRLRIPFRTVIEYNGRMYTISADPYTPSVRVSFTGSDGLLTVSNVFVFRDDTGTRYMNGLLYAFYRHAPPPVTIQEAAHEHLERLMDEKMKRKALPDFSDADWQDIADALVDLLSDEGHAIPRSFRELLAVSWTAEHFRTFFKDGYNDAGHRAAELAEKMLSMVFHPGEHESAAGVFLEIEPAVIDQRVGVSDLDKFLDDVTKKTDPFVEKEEALAIVRETLTEVFDSLSSWTTAEKKRVVETVLNNTRVLDERPWYERGLLSVCRILRIPRPAFLDGTVQVKEPFLRGGSPKVRINLYNMKNPRRDVRALVAGEVIRRTGARSMGLRNLQRDRLADALVLFLRSYGDREILISDFAASLEEKGTVSLNRQPCSERRR